MSVVPPTMASYCASALVRAVYSVRWFRVTPLTVMPTSPVKVTMLDFRPFSTS